MVKDLLPTFRVLLKLWLQQEIVTKAHYAEQHAPLVCPFCQSSADRFCDNFVCCKKDSDEISW